MSIFNRHYSRQAFAKVGLLGFTGSGKTYTATSLAIGLHGLLRLGSHPGANEPIRMLDTETGSDWVGDMVEDAGIEFLPAKTRAFTDVSPAIKEAEAGGGILLIDSITHYWRELTETYAKARNRTKGLEFQDWNWLKTQWGGMMDVFLNAKCHIFMCGRAGYEYDFFTSEGGKKEIEKTGIKMKAEGETGYEPSLTIYMQQHQKWIDMDEGKLETWHTALVMKDRSRKLHGQCIKNPTFNSFLPYFNSLHLGAPAEGIDMDRTSRDLIPHNGKSRWQFEKEQSEVARDEIKELLTKHYPGQTADAKTKKGDLLQKHFGTRSWAAIETNAVYDTLAKGRNTLWLELEGVNYSFSPPEDAGNTEGTDGETPNAGESATPF